MAKKGTGEFTVLLLDCRCLHRILHLRLSTCNTGDVPSLSPLAKCSTRDLLGDRRDHRGDKQYCAKKDGHLKNQINALVRKNFVYQRRQKCMMVCLVMLPVLFVGLLMLLQVYVDSVTKDSKRFQCGCACLSCCTGKEGKGTCRIPTLTEPCGQKDETCKEYDKTRCGIEFSEPWQARFCEVEHAPSWPPAMRIPKGVTDTSSRQLTFMYTGQPGGIASQLMEQMIPEFSLAKLLDNSGGPAKFREQQRKQGTLRGEALSGLGLLFGSPAKTDRTNFINSAYFSNGLSTVVKSCDGIPEDLFDSLASNLFESIARQGRFLDAIGVDNRTLEDIVGCVGVDWEERSIQEINEELFCTFKKARCGEVEIPTLSTDRNRRLLSGDSQHHSRRPLQQSDDVPNDSEFESSDTKYAYAWDFRATSPSLLDVDIWYKVFRSRGGRVPFLQRINLPQNLAANSWMRVAVGDEEVSGQLLATVEMPKPETNISLAISSVLGELLFTWIVQLLYPLMLSQIVYDKEYKLRTMMRMHGLGDVAYWVVNYLYYLLLYIVYISVLVGIGVAARLSIFTANSYSLQFAFYFLFGNIQIAWAFATSGFSHTKTATIFSFLWVFGTGLIGYTLLRTLSLQDRWYVSVIELVPAFGLYRGFLELSTYAFKAEFSSGGLMWSSLAEPNNHMDYVLLVFIIEWPILLLLGWYLEQVSTFGRGKAINPLWLLDAFKKKFGANKQKKIVDSQKDSLESSTQDSADVIEERNRVLRMTQDDIQNNVIFAKGLRKVFPAADGNAAKVAVHDLSMAVPRGEVFGLLGPNGAGKSTSINMLIGFLSPSAGEVKVGGFDIQTETAQVYRMMGVCPQEDLLWGSLTGMEHLLFYGRLKGLTGEALKRACESGLEAVNLRHGGVGDKQVKAYSGGMKRRLSVAISLIGNPTAVYLDEPSTGLDPASRRTLWTVVKQAKGSKAVILTTHSMQEAEVLCDRVGIFVGGRLVVLGNPKQLMASYGAHLLFTLTCAVQDRAEASSMVQGRFPEAVQTYAVAGTVKFELPVKSASLSEVFEFMTTVQAKLEVLDWGVTTASLEDVFMKIAVKSGADTATIT